MSHYDEYTTTLFISACCVCGIVFGVPENWDNKKRQNHTTIYCPNGCILSYPYESKEEKYKRLYNEKKNCCELKGQQLKTARASYHGLKGYVAKLKKQLKEVSHE